MALVEIDADTREADAMLNRTERAVGPESLTDWLKGPANDYLVRRIFERFQEEGDDASGRWLPLAEATREIRRELGYPEAHPINVRSNELASFLLSGTHTVTKSSSGAELTLPDSPPHAVLEKLTTAQVGRARNRIGTFGPTPPRPVLALNQKDGRELLQSLERHVNRRIMVGI